MENTSCLLTKMSKNQMNESDWVNFITLIINGCAELNFLFEENKNKACFGEDILIEYDGEQVVYFKGFKEHFINSEFKNYLISKSFFSPIKANATYSVKEECLNLSDSLCHQSFFEDKQKEIASILNKLEIDTVPVLAQKVSWGVYCLSLLKNKTQNNYPINLCKAGVLCLAISIVGSAKAEDAIKFESERGIDKFAKKMNQTIIENYKINPALQREMNQDPNFDKSRVVNYKRAGNQALNDYLKNDTGVYPALKSFENKIQNFFNGDDAIENREKFQKEGKLPKHITADLNEEDAFTVETQLKTQILKGEARFKIVTSIGEVSTEARAFGGEMFRASARTKALELKQFGIQVQGTVDYRNSEINSAIRTRINPNTSFHMENVRSVASEGKTDNRVRLNYDIDF